MTGVVRHPWGPRLYVAGLAMVVDDLKDFPWRDRDNHAPAGAAATA